MAGLPPDIFARLLAIVKGEDCVRIDLGNGRFAVIDKSDEPLVAQYRWRYVEPGYAHATIDGRPVPMHRLILGYPPKGVEVDHEDGDGLNNQRYNIRLCTRAENAKNRRSVSGQSRFKGVWKDKLAWRATIRVDGRKIGLGSFQTQQAAARAYDSAARRYHGEFAATNADLGLY